MSTDRRPMTSVAAGVILVLLSAAPGAVGAQNSTGGQGSTSASSSSQGSDQKDAPPKKPGPKEKPYGLIFGTAYGPDDHPIYGVHVTIHPEGHKKPSWELMSDHRGEFAQRVPPGPGDYVITGEVEIKPLVDGKPQKKKRLKGEAKVHLAGEEEQDFSLHMNE